MIDWLFLYLLENHQCVSPCTNAIPYCILYTVFDKKQIIIRSMAHWVLGGLDKICLALIVSNFGGIQTLARASEKPVLPYWLSRIFHLFCELKKGSDSTFPPQIKLISVAEIKNSNIFLIPDFFINYLGTFYNLGLFILSTKILNCLRSWNGFLDHQYLKSLGNLLFTSLCQHSARREVQ